MITIMTSDDLSREVHGDVCNYGKGGDMCPLETTSHPSWKPLYDQVFRAFVLVLTEVHMSNARMMREHDEGRHEPVV